MGFGVSVSSVAPSGAPLRDATVAIIWSLTKLVCSFSMDSLLVRDMVSALFAKVRTVLEVVET